MTRFLNGFFSTGDKRGTLSQQDNGAIILEIYQGILGRQPDQVGADYYSGLLANGGISISGICVDLLNSDEFASRWGEAKKDVEASKDIIRQCLSLILNRAVEREAVIYWQRLLDEGHNLREVLHSILSSDEVKQRRLGGIAFCAAEVIDSAFAALLGRPADEGALLTYGAAIDDRSLALSAFFANLLNSDEYKSKIGRDAEAFHNIMTELENSFLAKLWKLGFNLEVGPCANNIAPKMTSADAGFVSALIV